MPKIPNVLVKIILKDQSLFFSSRTKNREMRYLSTYREARDDVSGVIENLSAFTNKEVPGIRKLGRKLISCRPFDPCMSGACGNCQRALGMWLIRECESANRSFDRYSYAASFSFVGGYHADNGPKCTSTDAWGGWMEARYHALLDQAGLGNLFLVEDAKVVLIAGEPRVIRREIL